MGSHRNLRNNPMHFPMHRVRRCRPRTRWDVAPKDISPGPIPASGMSAMLHFVMDFLRSDPRLARATLRLLSWLRAEASAPQKLSSW
jgi:hypothetical protein